MCLSFEEQLIAGDNSLLNSRKRKSPDNKIKPLSKKPKVCPKVLDNSSIKKSLKPEKVEKPPKRIVAPMWTPKTVILGSGENSMRTYEIIDGKPKLLVCTEVKPKLKLSVPWDVVLQSFEIPPVPLSPIKTPVKKSSTVKEEPERPKIILKVPWDIVLQDFRIPPNALSPIKTPVKKDTLKVKKPLKHLENKENVLPVNKSRTMLEMKKYKVAPKLTTQIISPQPLKRTNLKRKFI